MKPHTTEGKDEFQFAFDARRRFEFRNERVAHILKRNAFHPENEKYANRSTQILRIPPMFVNKERRRASLIVLRAAAVTVGKSLIFSTLATFLR
ncbi:hypothetical protein CEXT_747741 [Caerostris extrusa]|uniref:Uncharacterized protein n=1 Tax=Caerostris extrusa TaxID=172846 RepID=A0AAV4T4U0_CAEEX|nr:hypothetical protein CEXT_747741 [Caerostris extrusa]